MSRTVGDWMSKPAVVVDRDTSVSHALKLMRQRKIHSVIVDLSAPGHPGEFGIVTATDIRDKIIGANRNAAETTVAAIMSTPVITANPEWTLKQCSLVMAEHNFHHLPVMDGGLLVGMISATDLFAAAEELGWEPED